MSESLREQVTALTRELLDRLDADGVRELEVRQGGIRVRVIAAGAAPPAPVTAAAAPSAVGPQGAAVTLAPAAAPASAKAVVAPLTGVFYRSPSPQAGPFVTEGSVVAVGDVIGLIEAMKLFNEIRSTAAGRVTRVVAEEGKLVRAHSPLIELE